MHTLACQSSTTGTTPFCLIRITSDVLCSSCTSICHLISTKHYRVELVVCDLDWFRQSRYFNTLFVDWSWLGHNGKDVPESTQCLHSLFHFWVVHPMEPLGKQQKSSNSDMLPGLHSSLYTWNLTIFPLCSLTFINSMPNLTIGNDNKLAYHFWLLWHLFVVL